MTSRAQKPFVERVNETALIEAALQDASKRTIIVKGHAGVGKSTLLGAIAAKHAASGTLVGVVHHIQDAGSSVEGIIRAIETMVSAGLDLLYEPESALHGLANLLGSSVDVLTDVGEGPFRRLRHYAQHTSAVLEADAAETRLANAIMRVLRWLQGFQAPLVLLLEDWGRADAATTQLYRRICSDIRLQCLRVLASERLTEPSTLQIDAAHITLSNFSTDELRQFVRTRVDQTNIDPDVIVETLIAIDAANPLRAEQYLRQEATSVMGVEGNATALFAARIRAAAGLDVLNGAAVQTSSATAIVQCLALVENAIDDMELRMLCAVGAEYEPSIAQLDTAGLIAHTSAGIQLAHETIRESVMRRLSPKERIQQSATFAERLRRSGADPASARGQLMLRLRAQGGASNIEPSVWQKNFYLGAAAARRRGERKFAHEFATIALALSSARGDADHNTLVEATLSAVEEGRFQDAFDYAKHMEANASNEQEKARATELTVYTARMAGDLSRALEAARTGLHKVGISAPLHAFSITSLTAIARAALCSPDVARTTSALTSNEVLNEAPLMRAIHSLAALLFERDPLLAAGFLACSVTPRLAAGTSAGAAAYGVICANLGLLRKAQAWSEISELRQSPEQPLRAAAKLYALNIGPRLTKGRVSLDEPRSRLIDLAIQEGELSVALYATRDRAFDALFGATSLAQARATVEQGLSIGTVRDPGIRYTFDALLRTVDLLSGAGANKTDIECTQELAAFASQTRRLVATLDAIVALAFCDYGGLLSLYHAHKKLFASVLNQDNSVTWAFIIAFGHFLSNINPPPEYLAVVARFARVNPENHLHRKLALSALSKIQRGQTHQALGLFLRSAECASRSWIEKGVILRACADSARHIGDLAMAARVADRARQAFNQLGAFALTSESRSDAIGADTKAELAEASRAATARARLLAAISHELRAPLQGAKAVLESDELDKTEARLALSSVVDQLTLCIDDLHQLATGEVGDLETRSRGFDLGAMLRELSVLWRPLLPLPRQLLVTNASTPSLAGDPPRMRQAIGNLLSNAIKYGKGNVTLSASVHPLREDAYRLHIFVDDEGAPLSETEWARLFEPFKRGEIEGTEGGLGLGLSIARRIAITLGGDLSVTQSPGGGTRFCLSVTCLSGSAPSLEAGLGGEVNVLLVEDEPLTRNGLAELLRRDGAKVTATGTASDADGYLESTFQLIILDANLPDGSGTALARRAKEKSPHATLAIISGGASHAISADASELGAIVLSKPIGAHDLRLLLSRSGQSPNRAAAVDALQTMIADLCEAERLGDHKQVRFLAHKVAGLSAQFKFHEVHDYAVSIEHQSPSAQADVVKSLQQATSRLVSSAS
jgi:signal transduction histidine kinase/DNA-binding response OmpR family regulator